MSEKTVYFCGGIIMSLTSLSLSVFIIYWAILLPSHSKAMYPKIASAFIEITAIELLVGIGLALLIAFMAAEAFRTARTVRRDRLSDTGKEKR